MRGARILAAVVLAGAALGATAPAAPAALADDNDMGGDAELGAGFDPANLQVFPKTVTQAGKLTVTVEGENCRHGEAYLESKAFPRTSLTALKNEGAAFATPVVFRHATPGSHSVTVTCKGKSVTGADFAVVRGHGPQGGEGGSVDGVSTTETVFGAVLVAAATAGGIYMMRRRMGSEGI